VATVLPTALQRFVHVGIDVRHLVGTRRQRRFDVVEAEHSESRDDLGDGRPEVGHY